MSGTLDDIREAMCRFAGSFDASRITATDAERLVSVAAAVESAAAAVKALAAARAAESNRWIRSGARSPAHLLAQETGASVGEAMRTLETGKRLAEQPAVREAAAAGELSAVQAAAVTDAAAVDPGAADRLLDVAASRSLAELPRGVPAGQGRRRPGR